MDRIYRLVLLFVSLKFSWNFPQIHQAVFLNPQTNSTFIRCPLDFIPNLDIQWYDDYNQKYDINRGRYYRINSLKPFEREFLCFSVHSTNNKYSIKIRVYGRLTSVFY